jgi:hypothetical protein
LTLTDDITKALRAATKDLYAEKKRRERDARTAQRPARAPSDRVALKHAVFEVMEAAILDASDSHKYPFPTRNLMYSVRPLIQQYTDEELKSGYFCQTLVVEYEREHGRIPGMYRDPRGHLYEPHTGKAVPLGTLEVADYILPEYVFDKILYVEKEGLNPIFQAAQLAERFDIAIASGKGQPVEAVRDLFARAEAGDYKLFVLHDADHSGYTIARAMREATKRMPHYNVEVIDLGLTVADAINGIEDVFEGPLQTERYTRKNELPWWMPDRLNDQEREWYEGERYWTGGYDRAGNPKYHWACTRVELNALKSRVIAYIEAGLKANDAADKIVPPDDVMQAEAKSALHEAVSAWLANHFTADLADHFADDVITDPAAWVADAYDQDRATWWKTAIGDAVGDRVEELEDDLEAELRRQLATTDDQEDEE